MELYLTIVIAVLLALAVWRMNENRIVPAPHSHDCDGENFDCCANYAGRWAE